MKIQNSIGWCDETTNAVTGCDKVSPGCKNCYAAVGTRARVLRGQGIETWGPKGVRHPVNFEPVFRRLNNLCICDRCHEAYPYDALVNGVTPSAMDHTCSLRRLRLFADSNSDWLDLRWPIETLARFLDAIRLAPNLDVLLLTKRLENWKDRIEAVLKWIEGNDCKCNDGTSNLGLRNFLADWSVLQKTPPNLWIGVSVEDQKRADERIPMLLQTPAAVRFISIEPLLEPIDLKYSCFNGSDSFGTMPGIDWVIVGGESGKWRRDCGVEAIIDCAEDCEEAGIPVYVKQDCAFKSGQPGRIPAAVWAKKEFPHLTPALSPSGEGERSSDRPPGLARRKHYVP